MNISSKIVATFCLLLTLSSVAGVLYFRREPSLPPVTGATSAERAVNAAKRFAGITLQIGSQSGLQTNELLNYSIPLWEKLTGIHVTVVQLGSSTDAMYRSLQMELAAPSSELDAASVTPSYIPDLVVSGTLQPLDQYLEHYMVAEEMDDYLPIYKDIGIYKNRRYGLYDDGDAILFFYRHDLLKDDKNQRSFTKKFTRSLGDPSEYDWAQWERVMQFFTDDAHGIKLGLAPFTGGIAFGLFQYMLRIGGGQYFDPATMQADVNSNVGVEALQQIMRLQKLSVPPSVLTGAPSSTHQPITTYLSGASVAALFWPPMGRWAELHLQETNSAWGIGTSFIPGRTGYALMPGKQTFISSGFVLSVMASSRRKEAAYLFLQWLNSPEISLKRVMRHDSLRDPFRYSHIRSPDYQKLWSSAPEYLELLRAAGTDAGLIDLSIPGTARYLEAFFEMWGGLHLDSNPDAATTLDSLASKWNQITSELGVAKQRHEYELFMQKPGARPWRHSQSGQ